MIRHKIPILLKLKRLKGSETIRGLNRLISGIKPSKKYPGIPKKILFFRNDRIGDAMVTLPVIRDLKLNYPDIEIDIIASSYNEFIFKEFEHIDNFIIFDINRNETGLMYKLPLIGGFILFAKNILFPMLFSKTFREQLSSLKKRKYDYAADLVGLKRNALIAGYISKFTGGPGRLLPFLFYDYYSDSNWVTIHDTDFMTRKIERLIEDSTDIRFIKRNTGLPFLKISSSSGPGYDIIIHLGTSGLRRLGYEKERELIQKLKVSKILITDSHETENFLKLKNEFSERGYADFKLYDSLGGLASECENSKILICYDGGQAHYLSQYIRVIVIFGPGSAELWKPYEFTEYKLLAENNHGVKAINSTGKFSHIAVYKPIWCSPCFDTGCKTKPCLAVITPEFILEVIKQTK
jgi:ADP-heptose:LPS heptosyltransferase